MIVTHHSPHFHHVLPPAFPFPVHSHHPGNPHIRSISTPTIANLTSTFTYKQPVQTGPPPFSRSSSIRQAAQDPASDDEKPDFERDELEGDDGDDEEDEDDFLAHQTKSTGPATTPNKRKGKV